MIISSVVVVVISVSIEASKVQQWQKGYPTLSEYPGEEGQPIPEMHDPLLNDPEVLQ